MVRHPRVEWSIVGSAVRWKCHRGLEVSYIPRKNTQCAPPPPPRPSRRIESGTTMEGWRRTQCPRRPRDSRCYVARRSPLSRLLFARRRDAPPALPPRRAEQVRVDSFFTVTMSRWVSTARARPASSLRCGKVRGG